jgi:nucleoid DNA-binding protein
MNKTKNDLIQAVSAKADVSQEGTRRVIEAMMEIIPQVLNEGHSIELRGFGKFEVKHRKAKVGRNIGLGQSVIIPERNQKTFRFTDNL